MEKTAAIIYVRVSTAEQATHGVSLDAQIASCRAYCLMARLDVVDVLTEGGVSASIALKERPEGARLLQALQRKRAAHVVAYKLDRLFRDAADALNQTRDWDKAGIAMHLVDVGGQTINTSTAMGRMFLTMMAGFAELERNLISERTTFALQRKKDQGQVVGKVPYGWRRNGDRLEPVEEEQAVRRQVLELHANGYAPHTMAKMLDALGVVSRNGKPFLPTQVERIAKYTPGAELR